MPLQLPPTLPTTGRNGALNAYFNQLVEAVRTLDHSPGPGSLTRQTAIGSSKSIFGEDALAGLNWKGEWQDQSYATGDLVIRGSQNESSADWNDAFTILSDGAIAGLYIAIQAVPEGTPPPEEPNSGDYWETFARYATNIFAMRDKSLPASGKLTLLTVDKDCSAELLGASGRAVKIKTSDCKAVPLGGTETGYELKVRAVKSCLPGDAPGTSYVRLVLCSERIRIA